MSADVADQNIALRVRRAIAEDQKIEIDKVQPAATFEELGIDSFEGVSLLFAIENEFDIQVPDEAARELRSVQDVIDGVRRLLDQKAQAAD